MNLKRIFLTTLLACGAIFGAQNASAQYVTVSGNLKTMFNANSATRMQVCFTLITSDGQSPADPHIAGVGILAPIRNQCISPAADGSFSVSMPANDQITVQGSTNNTLFAISYTYNGSFVSGATYSFLLADGTEDLNSKSPSSISPVPATVPTDNTYMRLDGGNSPATGSWRFNGAVIDNSTLTINGTTTAATVNSTSLNGPLGSGTPNIAAVTTLNASGNVTATAGQNTLKAYSFNTVLWVDGIKYTTLAGCYADIPSTGGVCMVPPNYSETLAASITCSKKYSGFVFTGPASIVAGSNQFIVSAGVHGCFIESWVPFGSAVVLAGTGVEWNYTGNSNAFVIGGSGADTEGFRLKDITIFMNNAGSAAVGLDIIRTPFCEIKNVHIIGPGGAVTQQGIILDGTGNFTGCTVNEPIITGVFKGIQFTGSGSNAGNANKIIGGQISSPANGTSLGLDFEAGSSGNTVLGTDVESHAVGYNFGSTSQGNYLAVRSEANTSAATFASGTIGNEIHLINSADPYTLAGVGNKVINLTTRTSTSTASYQAGCNGTATSSATLFLNPGYGSPTTCTDATGSARQLAASAGTVMNLRVLCLGAGKAAGSGVFTLLVNSAPTTLTCTVGTGTTCSDTTHTATVAASNNFLVQYTTQGTETLADCVATWEKQ